MAKIKDIKAREIVDSRGNPTVEADVILDNGVSGRAAPGVPAGYPRAEGRSRLLALHRDPPGRAGNRLCEE